MKLYGWGRARLLAVNALAVRRLALGSVLALTFALGGCKLVNLAPNDADALAAVRGVMAEVGVSLPPGFQLANVHVVSCVWQDSPDGHLCNVTLASTELPIVGAVSLPMRFRFAKREGRWKAFMF